MKKLLLLFIFLNGFLHAKEIVIENKAQFENILISDSLAKGNEKILLAKKNKIKKKNKVEKKQKTKNVFTFTFKPSYFWPQSKIYRGIYTGGFLPLIETCYIAKNGVGTFLEVGYFYKKTHKTSLNINSRVEIVQVPLSLGLSYTFYITSFLDFYLKIGPNWVYTKTKVDIPDIKHTVIKNTFGGTFGLGGKIHISKHLFLELFSDYLYDKKKVNDRDSGESVKVYLGGIQAGGGLGIIF